MYSKNETDISYNYLKEIISKLKEPIVIIGGWAVYLSVNKKYKQEQGVNYIGSRDIDLGFNTMDSLLETANILEKNGFSLIGFRYVKDIDYETGRELTKEEAKKSPQYNIFSMYVDLLISNIPKNAREHIGFIPADEPNLEIIFAESKHRKELIEFNRKLWLPSAEVLLLTKINSVINRSKDHKRTKDLCDIVALLLYSDSYPEELISFIKLNVKEDTLFKFKSNLTDKAILDISTIIRVNKDIISRILKEITY
jgi:hypothetical protein